MIPPPERTAERDAAIEAMLPNVPFDGWTLKALCSGLTAAFRAFGGSGKFGAA